MPRHSFLKRRSAEQHPSAHRCNQLNPKPASVPDFFSGPRELGPIRSAQVAFLWLALCLWNPPEKWLALYQWVVRYLGLATFLLRNCSTFMRSEVTRSRVQRFPVPVTNFGRGAFQCLAGQIYPYRSQDRGRQNVWGVTIQGIATGESAEFYCTN